MVISLTNIMDSLVSSALKNTKNVYISVVSHNNEDDIEKNFFCLPGSYGKYLVKVLIIDNTNSIALKEKCKEYGLSYYADNINRGYGANNNKNFELSQAEDCDVFIVCNPDVTIQPNQLEELFDSYFNEEADIFGVKVYESKDLLTFSSHNRNFPCLLDPIVSFVFKKKLFVEDADEYGHPDWIGGSFMVFKASSFKYLQGFDGKYFIEM